MIAEVESENVLSSQPIERNFIHHLGLFSKRERHMVEFLNFDKCPAPSNGSLRTQKCFDALSVQNNVEVVRNYRDHVQMIFLRQQNSYAPLDVSEEMVEAIIAGHDINIAIWNVLFSFRPRTNDLEETYSHCTYRLGTDGSFEIAFLFKFADSKRSTDSVQWVNRQVGIYQQYNKKKNRGIYILVLPNYDPDTLGFTSQIEQSATMQQKALKNPVSISLNLFTEHLHKTRLFLAEHEKRLMSIADDIFTVEIEDTLPFADMYESLQSLRFIESKLAPFLAIYCSHRTVLSKLVHINTSLLSNGAISQEQFYANTGTIDSLQESIAAYDRSTDFMLGRIRSTSQLISDTIALKSQNTSEVLSDQMLQHSGTIRVITLVTLVYLPATFVAGFFGMGFFSASDTGSGSSWITSPYVGLYFAVAVPLTALTLLYWKWKEQRLRMAPRRGETNFVAV